MNTPENRNAKKRCCSIPPEEELVFPTLNSEEKLALLMKALGHPARVKIIKLLLARDECICGEICREIPLAQSTISQHLKVLKDAGLIFGEVDGPRVCYCVNTVRLEHLKLLLSEL
ncbi:MAG: metalloregulator ArsR/SmtB family transcription factor [Candidatus Atribacteria bacterium]|nr:metalloregulator ArsR/SmtB family transcription factor [Candidatus Atribacteria bacterium]